MLSDNIRTFRKAKGLSQEELAIRLNVVRQTVSKWEQGLSVPDASMLITLSEVLESPVSMLLGETVPQTDAETLTAIAERLAVINQQLARRQATSRRIGHWLCVALGAGVILGFAFLAVMGSPYLGWNYTDPETAAIGAACHVFEYLYVRIAPFLLIGAVVGCILTRKKE